MTGQTYWDRNGLPRESESATVGRLRRILASNPDLTIRVKAQEAFDRIIGARYDDASGEAWFPVVEVPVVEVSVAEVPAA